MKETITWILFLIFIPLFSFTQNALVELTNAPWIDLIEQAALPAGADFNGEFLASASWDEKDGKCWFVLSMVQHEQELKNDFYVYQYKKTNQSIKLVWDIRDFSQPLSNILFAENSLQVLDLDGDGLMETSFIYHIPSDGADPQVVKLMLHSKGEKLAIRGSVPVMEDGEMVKNIDPVVKKYPPYFENFMSAEWEEYLSEGGILNSKQVHTVGNGFRLMQYWYQMASGGIFHQILDPMGNPMRLKGHGEDIVNSADNVLVLDDESSLIYARLPEIGWVNPSQKVQVTLITFFEDTEAISSMVLSPSGDKVAFFALNPNYAEGTKLFVLTLNGSKLVQKQKFDLPTFRMAASSWIVGAPMFIDDNTIEYQHWTNPDDEEQMKRISID